MEKIFRVPETPFRKNSFKKEQLSLTDCPGSILYCFLMMRKIYD